METVPHVLSRCSVLAQSKYNTRHDGLMQELWIRRGCYYQRLVARRWQKYAPLRWEIRQQYPHYKIAKYNVIVYVLGGVSRKTLDSIKDFVGVRADKILLDNYAKSSHLKYP